MAYKKEKAKKVNKIKQSNTIKFGRGKTILSIAIKQKTKIRPKKKG